MKTQLALITLLTLAGLTMFFQQDSVSMDEAELYQKYVMWKSEYNKLSGVGSDEYRFVVWSNNYKFVQEHNSKNSNLKLTVNKFADLDLDEFKALMLTRTSVERNGEVAKRTYAAVPAAIDWRAKGQVPPIQDQGNCGSCWAFSAVATLNSLHSIQEGTMIQFSEQQLVSCDMTSLGCHGGNEYFTMKGYTNTKGLQTNEDYPYEQATSSRTAPCKYDQSKVVWKNQGGILISANSPDAMKEVVAKNPISIAIDGGSIYFQLYKSGILDNTNCGTFLNHAINIVGYDTSVETPYWIVRNSWGTGWGDQGYAKFAIIDGVGICGSQKEPSYAY